MHPASPGGSGTWSASLRASNLPLVLAGAVLAHNLEEAVMLAAYPGVLQWPIRLGLLDYMPALATIRWGIIAFAIVPVAILLRAWARPTRRLMFVTAMIGAMTAFNAIMPHGVAAILSGGYVPGLVTAIALTLPAGALTLWRSASARELGGAATAFAGLIGVLLLPLVLLGFWALNELVVSLA